jgi:hypothetical protein
MILSLPKDLTFETIKSVMQQTIPVDMIVLLTKRSNKSTQDERTAEALNDGLEKIDLKKFDYILRVDGHVVLPKDFLEKNLEGEPDTMYGSGFEIVKVAPFIEIMGGRYYPMNDDSYLNAKFTQFGKRVEEQKIGLLHKEHPFNPNYYMERGRTLYRLGWTPFHVIGIYMTSKLTRKRTAAFVIGSYFLSFLARPPKYDVANFVTGYQVQSEVKHLTKLFKKFSHVRFW